jgi:hypothetical protein
VPVVRPLLKVLHCCLENGLTNAPMMIQNICADMLMREACVSSVLVQLVIGDPASTEDETPQHPIWVVFEIWRPGGLANSDGAAGSYEKTWLRMRCPSIMRRTPLAMPHRPGVPPKGGDSLSFMLGGTGNPTSPPAWRHGAPHLSTLKSVVRVPTQPQPDTSLSRGATRFVTAATKLEAIVEGPRDS